MRPRVLIGEPTRNDPILDGSFIRHMRRDHWRMIYCMQLVSQLIVDADGLTIPNFHIVEIATLEIRFDGDQQVQEHSAITPPLPSHEASSFYS